jgi:hypothetical protein
VNYNISGKALGKGFKENHTKALINTEVGRFRINQIFRDKKGIDRKTSKKEVQE